MSEGDSIRALATVTFDVRSLDPDSIERLAELVEARIAGRRESTADRLLSVDDVAELSGLSRSLVYREIERGHLRRTRSGRGCGSSRRPWRGGRSAARCGRDRCRRCTSR
jgi:excisionase family DNA binding protein